MRAGLARRALPALLCCALLQPVGAAEFQPADARPALVTPRAAGGVLLSIAQAGNRLVTVGERGIVLLSDDGGTRWRQAIVPVSSTLTAVRFIDARQGWAVGHAGVVLHSEDGGEHWEKQLDGRLAAALVLRASAGNPVALKSAQQLVDDGADKPLLDLHFFDARRGIVVGAYGLIFGTEDGGRSWTPWMDRLDNPKGLHLNAIAVRDRTLMLVGEQGAVFLSTDAGGHFKPLDSPYAGSWFALAAPGDAAPTRWLLGGLRGRLYAFDAAAGTFAALQSPNPVTWSGFQRLRDGRVLGLGQSGALFSTQDQGLSFQAVPVPPGAPLTGVVVADGGTWVASSLRGPRLLPSSP